MNFEEIKHILYNCSKTIDESTNRVETSDEIIDYINELQQENQQLKIQISAREEEYRKLENNWNKVKADLELLAEYGDGEDASEWDKRYGEFAKNHLRYIKELEGKSE